MNQKLKNKIIKVNNLLAEAHGILTALSEDETDILYETLEEYCEQRGIKPFFIVTDILRLKQILQNFGK